MSQGIHGWLDNSAWRASVLVVGAALGFSGCSDESAGSETPNAGGGNTAGGNTAGGNTAGGNTAGGNTAGGNADDGPGTVGSNVSSGGGANSSASGGSDGGGTGGTTATGTPNTLTGNAANSGSGGASATTAGSGTTGVGDGGEVRAFPGAEGFAAMITGGRGGRVLKVTTLDASGPGSLQAALDESGPRIIVFEVSGVIEAGIIEISSGDVTIAGQTAPGGGITIQGRLYGTYDYSVGNIIIRHLRIRPEYDGSEGDQFDAIQLSRNHHIMLDHLSVAFGVDETICLYGSQDVTIQWSTIESSATEGHPEGQHNYGMINGPEGSRVSVHHNLFAHHRNRSPAIANGPAEVRNNVIYNVRHGFVHHNPASGPFNFVGNYFKAGGDDTLIPFYFDDENGSAASDLAYYLEGNWVEGTNSECAEGELNDPWSQCDLDLVRDSSFQATSEFDFSGESSDFRSVRTTSAAQAFSDVLARAGAFPRDVVALRSVSETEAGTGSWGTRTPSDLMEGLSPTTPPVDSDDDGMADEWEASHGLDPSDSDDHTTVMESGYTAIEEYINELAVGLGG